MPCRDAIGAVWGPTLWGRTAGLDASTPVQVSTGDVLDQVPISWVTSMPIPVAAHNGYGPHRWPTCTPTELVWPWMWLPPRLARPQVWESTSHAPGLEPVDVWQTRVALELGNAGLFDPDIGWVDVLATMAGIDVDDPGDADRVRDWLSGVADPQLDEVGDTFNQRFLPEDMNDPTWAVDEATVLSLIPARPSDPCGPMVLAGAHQCAAALLEVVTSRASLPIADATMVADLGGCLPGQTSAAHHEWARIGADLRDAPDDPWTVAHAMGAATQALHTVMDDTRHALPFVSARFGLDGLITPA